MSTDTATEGIAESVTKKTRTNKAAKAGTKKRSKAATAKSKRAAGKAESANKERTATKKAIVLELLRRKEGATLAEIAKATDWQNHSIRGFIVHQRNTHEENGIGS